MSNTSSSSSGGIGFAGLLTIVFITLKLTGVIAWSWVWVLSPIWISLSLVLLFLFIALVCAVIAKKCEAKIRELETPSQRAARTARELSQRLRNP